MADIQSPSSDAPNRKAFVAGLHRRSSPTCHQGVPPSPKTFLCLVPPHLISDCGSTAHQAKTEDSCDRRLLDLNLGASLVNFHIWLADEVVQLL